VSYRVICLSRPSAAPGRGFCSIEWLGVIQGYFGWLFWNVDEYPWPLNVVYKLHCRTFVQRLIGIWLDCHTGLLVGLSLNCGHESLNIVYKLHCRTFVQRLIGIWLGVIQGYFGWLVQLLWPLNVSKNYPVGQLFRD